MNVVSLNTIKPWSEYVIYKSLAIPKNPIYPVDDEINSKISLWKGDMGMSIVHLKVDAIVNAANEILLGGGGIDKAIHAAAGPGLMAECEKLPILKPNTKIRCNPGSAKITSGHNLPAKYVIHAVGPRGVDPYTLEKTYDACLNLMMQNNIKTIAFPCISTGIFHYTSKDAVPVVAEVVRKFLDTNKGQVDRIIFCMFTKDELRVYERALPYYFPTNSVRFASSSSLRSPGRVPNFNQTAAVRSSRRAPDFVPMSPKRSSRQVPDFVTKSPVRSSRRVPDFYSVGPGRSSRRVPEFIPTSPVRSSRKVSDFVTRSPVRSSRRVADFYSMSPERSSIHVPEFAPTSPVRSSRRVPAFATTSPIGSSRRVPDIVPMSPHQSPRRVMDYSPPTRFPYFSSKVSGRSSRPWTNYFSSTISRSSIQMPDYVSTTSIRSRGVHFFPTSRSKYYTYYPLTTASEIQYADYPKGMARRTPPRRVPFLAPMSSRGSLSSYPDFESSFRGSSWRPFDCSSKRYTRFSP